MSEAEKVNSAVTKWRIGLFWQKLEEKYNIIQVYRSDIYMGEHDRVGMDELYMIRYLLEVGPARRSLRLHIIFREDVDNCLHDHPWHFLAFLLWGGYVEEVPHCRGDGTCVCDMEGFPVRKEVTVKPFRFHWRPLDYKHRIVRLLKRFSVSLIYAGPIQQHWGFHTNHGKEDWENFVDKPSAVRIPWCEVNSGV